MAAAVAVAACIAVTAAADQMNSSMLEFIDNDFPSSLMICEITSC